MTIGEAEIRIYRSIQAIYDPDEAKAVAQLALSHVCGISKIQLKLKKQDPLYKMEERSLNLLLDEILTGKPIQYIIGETPFFGLRLKVTPAVLIPRPETEELVGWILEEAGDNVGNQVRILDIGTGSGCIPVALKSHLPEADIYGMDVSLEALQIAEENAVLNEVQVHFIHSDILQWASVAMESAITYTMIVSNPPYITQSEKKQMHQNVLHFEPELALFVPDDNPLLFYKAIADFAVVNLETEGQLFLEINEVLGAETTRMLREKGFNSVELRKDMQGKDRIIRATL